MRCHRILSLAIGTVVGLALIGAVGTDRAAGAPATPGTPGAGNPGAGAKTPEAAAATQPAGNSGTPGAGTPGAGTPAAQTPGVNPMYAAWANFKPGATVTSQSKDENDGVTTTTGRVYTLVSADADKVVVEMVSTRTVGPAAAAPVKSTQTYTKAGASSGRGDADVKRTEGDEELEVAGQKVKCHWEQVTFKGPESTVVLKTWTSPQVPGGTAKSQTTRQRQKDGQTITTKATMIVTAFAAKP